MAGFSDAVEADLLNAVFRNTAYTSPAAVYVGLFTSPPTSDSGTGGTEVSGNNYSRQAVTFGAPSAGTITNSSAPGFAASGGAWGTVTHFGIFDAPSAGNLLGWDALSASKTIADGDTATFGVGTLTVTLD